MYIDVPALRPGTVGSYALAFLSALAATVVRVAVDPYISGVQYITFYPAVTITTLTGGLRAGLLCAMLSVAAVVFLVRTPSFYIDNPAELPALLLFVLIMLSDVIVATAMRWATESYRELSRHLEQRVEERTAEVLQRSRELADANRLLRQTNEERSAIYEQGLYATHIDIDGRVINANGACVEGCGYGRTEIVGRLFWECPWWHLPETRAWVRGAFERAAEGESVRGETPYVFKDGTEHVSDIALIPIRDDAGRVVFVFAPGMDVTERARQYRATFETAAVGIAHLDLDITCRQANQALARIVGYSVGELAGMSFVDLNHPDDVDASLAQIARISEGKIDSYELEKRYVRKDGTPVWVRVNVSGVRRGDGSIDHFIEVIQDITARRQAQEQVQFLMREMNHRAKNLLSLVQAIAQQTAASDSGHFLERFTECIRALAANQDLLLRNEWRGVDVEQLVRVQLAPFADSLGSRIMLAGPKLHLNTPAAQAIGLALHELATNAGKYGALSTSAGHVDIGWQVDGEVFTMNWKESGGPSVSAPERRGFGTIVIDLMAKRAVDGGVEIDYAPSGVAWRLACPAANALLPGTAST